MKDIFRTGEIVVHKREGISKIVSTSLIYEKEYFVLESQAGNGEMIYAPIDTCTSVIRKVMTKNEAEDVLDFMKTIDMVCMPNAKQRRDYYKKLLNSGEVNDIALLSRQYLLYEGGYKDLESPEMHLGTLDIDMLKMAHTMLMEEMSLIYNKASDTIETFIKKKLEK
ncbi:MAG: CarD family transcriptional regulator [Bacilli bacterium]|nr:CarD family transcriptional regulator [Bacilli bacterium]